MQDKILSVFYGEDRLPYKDASRETHYPIVNGNVFNGANNVTKIRYYLDRIGGFTNVTWVVVSKLPNSQLASEMLNSNQAVYDEELGEHYIDFEISSYYTTLKGDVYLSLQGYQGGVEMEQDDDTGIYSIYGTPTIQATGSIKIGVNYAPQIVQGTHFTTSDLQQVLGLISEKANISDTFIIIDNLAADISGFNVGQVFFDKQTKSYWVKGNDNSLQGFDVKLERAVELAGTETIATIILPQVDIGNWGIGKYNNTLLFVKVALLTTPTPHIEYTIYQLSNTGGVKCWYNTNAIGNETIASIVSSTPTYEFATQEYVGTQLSNYYTKSETEEKIDDKIADFMQREYQNVDTTTYPTLDDFLASTGEEGYIYLYPIDTTDLTKGYYQYIWENNAWLSLGTTQIDLSGYYTKTQADNKFATITYVESIDAELDTKQDTLVSGTNIKTLNGTSLLGSGDIEYDDEFDEESTNALQNQVISKEIKELNYELAIIREELFEVLLTELDYKVSYAMNYVVPDSLSDSDGTHRVVYSETMLKEIEGNGVALNQLAINGNFASTSGWSGVGASLSVSSNVATLTANISQSYSRLYRNNATKTIVGHKYLVTYNVKVSNATALSQASFQCGGVSTSNAMSGATINAWFAFRKIITSTSATGTIQVSFENSGIEESYTFDVKNIDIIDLTQMFGAGNEPTTTSDNRIQWLLSLGYVPYNTGSLENTTISGVKLVGFNKWDEIYDFKGINANTGQVGTWNDRIASTNYINVVAGQTYYFNQPYFYIFEYDINKNYIGKADIEGSGYTQTNKHIFTTKNNTAYIKFSRIDNGYGTVYKNDICINISSSLNGTYKPYIETTISLPQTTLLGLTTIHDTLSVVEGNVVEGEQLYNIVHDAKIKQYSWAGSESWSFNSGSNFFYTTLYGETPPNTTTPKTSNGIVGSLYANGIFRVYLTDNPQLTSSSNMSAIFSNGTKMQYLITSTQTIVAQYLHFDQVSSVIEQGGTIEPIFEDVPPNITTTFVVKKAVGE